MSPSRYLFFLSRIMKGRGNTSTPFLLAVLGTAFGTAAMILVLGIMNGFQLRFIDSIIGVKAYQATISTAGEDLSALKHQLSDVPVVSKAVPFVDGQTLFTTDYGYEQGLLVRGIDADSAMSDTRFFDSLKMVRGRFDVHDNRIIIGYELALKTGIEVGDKIELLNLSGSSAMNISQTPYVVTGLFHSGYYEYNNGLAFINYNNAVEMFGSSGSGIGIRFSRGVSLGKGMSIIHQQTGMEPVSWKYENPAFFNALRMEKLAMGVLVGLIFLVVAMNLYLAIRREIHDRLEEIALLKVLGARPTEVRNLFVLKGLILGAAGSIGGAILGLLFAEHLQSIVSGVNSFVTAYLYMLGDMAGRLGLTWYPPVLAGNLSLEGVPCRVLWWEPFLTVWTGLTCAFLSSIIASAESVSLRPATVIKGDV